MKDLFFGFAVVLSAVCANAGGIPEIYSGGYTDSLYDFTRMYNYTIEGTNSETGQSWTSRVEANPSKDDMIFNFTQDEIVVIDPTKDGHVFNILTNGETSNAPDSYMDYLRKRRGELSKLMKSIKITNTRELEGDERGYQTAAIFTFENSPKQKSLYRIGLDLEMGYEIKLYDVCPEAKIVKESNYSYVQQVKGILGTMPSCLVTKVTSMDVVGIKLNGENSIRTPVGRIIASVFDLMFKIVSFPTLVDVEEVYFPNFYYESRH